jgi:hypothetical protein
MFCLRHPANAAIAVIPAKAGIHFDFAVQSKNGSRLSPG